MRPVKVLIVDDSATIRQLIRLRLREDPRLDVVGEACDAYEAREKIKALNPDVITLDVEMPRMNGLEFLEKLMRLRPMPVVMVSSETHRGSTAALEALSLGAVECIGKSAGPTTADSFASLPDILVAAAGARLMRPGARPAIAPATGFRWNGRYVFIGSSTGGVDALETVLAGYPKDCPPTLITQHMPAGFLASFAARLSPRVAPEVQLATEGAMLKQGHVYIAPGGDYHLAVRGDRAPACHLVASEKRNGHRPSVEVMFDSALPIAKQSVCVMLTGMGRDGADGMLRMREAGASCIAQDEASSVVFGMPRAALEIGAASVAVPITRISEEILTLTCKDRAASARRTRASDAGSRGLCA